MRILSAGISHETNTFAATPTTLDDFFRGWPGVSSPADLPGSEAIRNRVRGTRTIHGGYLAAADRLDLELEPLLTASATPGGVVLQSAYDALKSELLKRFATTLPCDGVLLDLHGAMVTGDLEDAEGDLIAAVRARVGRGCPIVVTLDLHANVTEQMVENADAVIGFDEYPHIDMYERGVEAAELLAQILRGKVQPTLARCQMPLITMPPRQCTFGEPMRSLLDQARAMEDEPGVLNVTLAMGFPFADIREAGVNVLVTTNGDEDLAERKAREMADAIWSRRTEFTVQLTPVSEAIQWATEHVTGLVVLADGSDNPGGGGPCDGTVVLRELLASGATDAVVAVIADPQAVDQAIRAGLRNTVTLSLGGKTDDRHGEPVELTAYVRMISDGEFVLRGPMGEGAVARMGRAVVLVAGGVEIVVTERRIQPYDTALLRSLGIEPTHRRIVALKSAVHFRSTYQDIAERIFEVDTPGVHRPEFAAHEYRRLRRPIYPLDPVSEW